VVVAADQQGKGLGKLLYTDLFAFAGRTGALRVCCEFDVEPPNEPSRLFHHRFGFREVGTQRVAAGKKQVSLQVASLPLQTASRGAE
jgi:predicted GNAT superfamily acetyltransferase